MIRIGLTGPMGCGKSTVAGWLGELPGVVVIDADRVARDVLAPGTPELTAVVERFGSHLVDADGILDRAALGRIVFADPEALRDLEAIVHPAVRARIHGWLMSNAEAEVDVSVIEAIRLVDGPIADWCDEVWMVTCDPETQRQRSADRGLAPEEADRRIAAQADLIPRMRERADRVIDTSGSPDVTRAGVVAALDAALSRTA